MGVAVLHEMTSRRYYHQSTTYSLPLLILYKLRSTSSWLAHYPERSGGISCTNTNFVHTSWRKSSFRRLSRYAEACERSWPGFLKILLQQRNHRILREMTNASELLLQNYESWCRCTLREMAPNLIALDNAYIN